MNANMFLREMNNFKCIVITGICFLLLACVENDTTYLEKQKFNKDWTFKLVEVSETENNYFQKDIEEENWKA